MESDSENENTPETRSRNSSVSSSEDNKQTDRDDFHLENQSHPAELRRRSNQEKRLTSKRRHSRESESNQPPGAIHYYGVTLSMAASQGSLPVTVLLWGFAAARRVNLMVPDANGNNPIHFAALADSPEVLGFLLQQTRGLISTDTKLVDTRNALGETPLLRAAGVGKIPVVKALLDEGSDPFAQDVRGQNALIILARNGNLWCLNYYWTFISDKFGVQTANTMLFAVDIEGHGALDWAADNGSVSVLEYLIRKGLDPFRVDQYHRGPLYWAVKSRRLHAAKFLVLCGCDPWYEDNNSQHPIGLAEQLCDKDLVTALKSPVPPHLKVEVPSLGSNELLRQTSKDMRSPDSPRRLADRRVQSSRHVDVEMSVLSQENAEHVLPSGPTKLSTFVSSTSSTNNSSTSSASSSSSFRESVDANAFKGSFPGVESGASRVSLWSMDGCGIVSYLPSRSRWPLRGSSGVSCRKSKAIMRQNETQLNLLLCCTFVLVFYWFLMLCIPVYAYIIFAALSAYAMQRLVQTAKAYKPTEKQRPLWMDIVLSRERYVSVYCGTFAAVIFYCLYCAIVWIDMDAIPHFNPVIDKNAFEAGSVNFLVGATSAATKHPALFLAIMCGLVVCACLWTAIVFSLVDMGSVDTRSIDFEELLQASLKANGAPSPQLYCRTLLVRKPIRSKYCSSTGFVVARMDHHCVWLNATIGFGNHRLFLVFLVVHIVTLAMLIAFIVWSLQWELGSHWQCGIVERLLSSKYFFVTALCASLIIVVSLLTVLLLEQVRNIVLNVTTNEKINYARYAWMVNELGQPSNRFDRGWWSNIMEFFLVPGYAIDYKTVFEIPNSSAMPAANNPTSEGTPAE